MHSGTGLHSFIYIQKHIYTSNIGSVLIDKTHGPTACCLQEIHFTFKHRVKVKGSKQALLTNANQYKVSLAITGKMTLNHNCKRDNKGL